ncbi:Uncharacterized protein Adt_16906 [Abeliophyllum distichum]|uniref:Uncharacterized protein n=1 Tax=Abeliophyllum distichum TaxID=126358 RepID=A0ABD1TF00_9LAMI
MKGKWEDGEMKKWDCGSPLYDSYELVSVSHLIERHFMILPYYDLRGSSRASPNQMEESTLMCFLSELVESKAWKREMDTKRGKKKKKKSKTGISRICNEMCLWKK